MSDAAGGASGEPGGTHGGSVHGGAAREPASLPRGVRLGVDVGSVRVGLAASDPDGLIATPVETLARDIPDDEKMVPACVARIVAEVTERAAAVVYVGLPRHLSGHEGAAAASAREYAGRIAELVAPVEVRIVDERMTTVTAHQILRTAGRDARKRRNVVDQAAAVIILQAALDYERGVRRRAGVTVGD